MKLPKEAELINIVIALLGTCLIISGQLTDYVYRSVDLKTILLSVGCSLLATAIVSFLSVRYLLRSQKTREIIDLWGLVSIYETRAQMNSSCDKAQDKAKKQIDIIAFGLRSWREKEEMIKKNLKSGVQIRILAPEPNSPFVEQRRKDEDETTNIALSIKDLANWVVQMKKFGCIEIRFYHCLPLDFYFRVDDSMFLGPYMFKTDSQRTVSFEYTKGKMFDLQSSYFEKVWENATNSLP